MQFDENDWQGQLHYAAFRDGLENAVAGPQYRRRLSLGGALDS
jgi:hypothetical protein